MIDNLPCFKCHKDIARITYQENRVYRVACICGCNYEFNHCSMDDAIQYHYKMWELYGEIDRAKAMQLENEKWNNSDCNTCPLQSVELCELICANKLTLLKFAKASLDEVERLTASHDEEAKSIVELTNKIALERNVLKNENEKLKAKIIDSEYAIEIMTYIIQKVAHNRCDYCIYRTEPCHARGLNAECQFQYVEDVDA